MGFRFKLANWILRDELRFNLACAKNDLNQIIYYANLDKEFNYPMTTPRRAVELWAPKAIRNIDNIFEM